MAQKSKHYIRAETDMKNLGIYKPEFDSMIAVYAQLMTQRDKLESEYKKGSTFYVFVPSGDNRWSEDE